MQLSELLGVTAVDAQGDRVGTVIDVRLQLPDERRDVPELLGLIISPHTASSYLGYERTGARAPWMLSALARWRHRGTFLAEWPDIGQVDHDRITLRPNFIRHDPAFG
jgi:sporulation protein YlmC with PRC-barrel domain